MGSPIPWDRLLEFCQKGHELPYSIATYIRYSRVGEFLGPNNGASGDKGVVIDLTNLHDECNVTSHRFVIFNIL